MMLVNAGQFLLDVLLQSYAAILLLRFHLQWLRAPLRNPLGEFIMLLTNPLVLRARRFIPSIQGLDTASLLLAGMMEMLYLLATLWIHSVPLSSLPFLPLLAWTVIKLLKASVYLLMGALFMRMLLSWTNPNTPFAPVLDAATAPFLRPLRRWVPQAGNFDFTYLALFLLCQLILMLPLAWVEGIILSALT